MAEDMFAQKGWICPKCGRVLAPSTMYCLWCCSDMKESITTTGKSIPKWDTTPIKGSRMIDSSGQTDCAWMKPEEFNCKECRWWSPIKKTCHYDGFPCKYEPIPII